MDHAYFKDRLSALFDNELPPQEKQIVEEHVRECVECQQTLANLQQLEDAVKRHSKLADSDYWEESAQKIERELGFDQQTIITPVGRKSFERGLAWKALAAAASIGVLAYIGFNSDKILKPKDLEPSKAQPTISIIPNPVAPSEGTLSDSVTQQKVKPAGSPTEAVGVEAAKKGAEAVESRARLKDELMPGKKIALPAPEQQDINLSAQTSRDTAERFLPPPESAPVSDNVPLGRASASPASLSAETSRPEADEVVGKFEEESKQAAIAQIDTAQVDSTLVWWRKKRDALLAIRQIVPGAESSAKVDRFTAAPSKQREADKPSPQLTRKEVESQLLAAWYNIARLTKESSEREQAITEIQKVADNPKSPNYKIAISYLEQLGAR